MFKGSKAIVAVAAVVILIGAVSYRGYVSAHHGPSASAAAAANGAACCLGADPAQQLRVTLDPAKFQGEVREAYAVAGHDPALLVQLHCYCGCDKEQGHKNLLDCFRDEHGSKCAICVGEARDAETMASRGVSVEQIRDTLRLRYAHGS